MDHQQQQRQAYLTALHQQALREGRAGDVRQAQRLKLDERSDGEQISPINGQNRQHLTGEMIRQLRQQKEKAQACGLLGGAKNSVIGGGDSSSKQQLSAAQQQQMQAATYAAIQQHQLQMHAVYERALKVCNAERLAHQPLSVISIC